eukprot:3208526-Pyramimonas_sp.AAC.1
MERFGDSPTGVNPCVIYVVGGAVDIRQISEMEREGRVPTARHMAENIQRIKRLQGKLFRDFFVSLMNMSAKQHSDLITVIFAQ